MSANSASYSSVVAAHNIQGDRTGYRAGNREKLNSTQAEPGQAITSAVAYFPSISCATFCLVALYIGYCDYFPNGRGW